jgi:NADPH:quinone reductase-like Zn-dependent oxidoreductase
MRAYQLPKGGAGIDALVQIERPDPKPAYRQILVKIKACSLIFAILPLRAAAIACLCAKT